MPMTPVQLSVSRGINPYVQDFAEHDEKPSALDMWAAAARQAAPGALYERLTMPDPDLPDAPQGWDPLDHLQGYEDYASQATQLQTPSDLAGWKARVDSQRIDRDVLRRSGFVGLGAEMAMLVSDPSFLASIAVPELGMARLARSGRALAVAARGAAEGGVYELGMQNLQETRTASDALLSVGGGAFIGGVLGSLTRGVPKADLKKLHEAVRADLNPNVTAQSFGAAATERPTTLAAESLAPGAKQVSAAMSNVPLIHTDLDTVMASSSVRAHTIMQDLATVPQMLRKNVDGIATPQSVEVAVGRYQAVLADFSDLFRANYAKAKKATGMGYEEFGTAVSNAARQGDAHPVPEVAETARFWRSRIADPLKEGAQQVGLLGDVEKVVGAPSYFTRRYNRELIRANELAWEDTLFRWFSQTSDAMEAEIRTAIDDVTRHILGADVGQANFNVRITAEKAGPLKERVLDIPDEMIAQFLDNNPLRIAASYINDLAPQVEMAKRFGDFEMKDSVTKIQDEYSVLREKAKDAADPDKAIEKLRSEEKEVLDSMLRVRDRILGRAGRVSPQTGKSGRRAVAASRGWRNLVTASKLGATALTGGTMDASRIIIENGFLPTMQKLVKLATSPEFRALSKAQARRVGAAVEVALSRRVMVMYDGAVTEGWTQKLANSLYKYTGLNHLMDFNRTVACSLLEDRILKTATQLAEGGKPRKFELARLASLGLDEDALREIAAEAGRHGGETSGVRVSGSADWRNKALADAYDNALLKESKIVVVEPGAADRVWWMDKEVGKFIGQLKTFTLSAPARLTSAPLAMIGTGNYAGAARFVGFLMAGGYLTHAIRQFVAGKDPVTNPLQAANEAFSETGMAGVIPDLLSPLARRVGFGESVRMADRNVLSAYGGPALGSAADVYDLLYNRTSGGISANDLHMIRRMLPWQNAWMLRRGINALEGELAESLQLTNSDAASVGERIMRTDAVLPAKERGGTGTGIQP